jgi:hypothetical protein
MYWSSTKSPVHLFPAQKYESADVAAYLREHSFVDSKLLAVDLKMAPQWVEAYQRRLGVRHITGPRDYAHNAKQSLHRDAKQLLRSPHNAGGVFE